MDRQLLGFKLGNDAIRAASGIIITPAGVVSFAGRKATVCATINLDEPDFCVEFNQMQNCLTAKWK